MTIDFSCYTAILRGRLKHSWLENQVLNKSAKDILEMRSEGAWNALMEQFPTRVREARGLVEAMLEGFSPAQLVDRIEIFAVLSETTKASLRGTLHSGYLAQSEVRAQQQSLASTTNELAGVLDRVSRLWREGSDCDLERAWQDVISAAAALRDELEALPKGIVLP